MTRNNLRHEDIIKFIILLDKWRSRPPLPSELQVLNTAGVKLFPEEVRQTTRLSNNLDIHPRHQIIERIHIPIQRISIALTLFFVFTLISYLSRSVAWQFAESLIFNPLFVLTIMSSFIINGFIMYQHRRLGLKYRIDNQETLNEFKDIIELLLEQLRFLALQNVFKPKNYPFKLQFDEYQGLRLIGKSGSSIHLMFSISHSLFIKHASVKIMTSMGRLSFFDGLAGFRGGRPEIRMVVGQVAGDLKTYLKKCADWRQQGIDILVRKAKQHQIKRTYIILDNNTIWVSSLILEEFDSVDTLDLKKITDQNEKKRIIKHFSQLWEISQKSDELEALSWRSYFKERTNTKK